MSALRVELPEELCVEVADRLARRGISEPAWVEEALALRAARGNRAAFERILARVPDVPPDPGDER